VKKRKKIEKVVCLSNRTRLEEKNMRALEEKRLHSKNVGIIVFLKMKMMIALLRWKYSRMRLLSKLKHYSKQMYQRIWVEEVSSVLLVYLMIK